MKIRFMLSGLAFTFLIVYLLLLGCVNHSRPQMTENPPAWANEVVWYQIFVERFYNGDSLNDPTPSTISTHSDFFKVPENWHITPWTRNWYAQDDWATQLSDNFYANLQLRRYGGDLQGVMNKLDYLQELGVTAIYFNPLNDAPSLHKYDARNFHHIDINFGPDPEGDLKIIKRENPDDVTTWQWTSADRLFLNLVDSLHRRGMRVILDYSWNHTGVEFWAWRNLIQNGKNSPFADWYSILRFDDPQTPQNEFDYRGWIDIKSLPEIKKVNTTEEHRSGFPFEGDLNYEAKKHVLAVTQRWLAPDGDLKNGIDGFRLDGADHIPMGFWRDYREFVRKLNPEAYLVGELWWQDFPDHLMNPEPYLKGDVFDAAMFYQLYRPARYFFAQTDYSINSAQLADSLMFQWNRIRPETRFAMMNTASTHDSPRLLTSFGNRNKYKFSAKPSDNSKYYAGAPTNETRARVRLYLLHQFTTIGAPHVFNGEEMGMWGADDPDCRKPLWWPEMRFEPENRLGLSENDTASDPVQFDNETFNWYKKLIAMRKQNPVLSHGALVFLPSDKKVLAYKRVEAENEILTVLNAGNEIIHFQLNQGMKYKDILTGEEHKDQVIVEPIDGIVLRKIAE